MRNRENEKRIETPSGKESTRARAREKDSEREKQRRRDREE